MTGALTRVGIALGLTLASAGAVLLGYRWWEANRSVQETNDAYVRAEITTLSPRVAGYAVEIRADDNSAVKAGEIIVRLDPRDYRANLDRARASDTQARAALTQSRARRDLQMSQIEVAEAALRSAEAQAQNSDTALSRTQSLADKGVATQASLDAATATAVSARSAVDSARASLTFQRRDLVVVDADIANAEAKLQDTAAALNSARIALEDTQVWAPVDGIVANRRTRVGEYVTAGTRMLSIVPSRGLWIEANFRETQLAYMKPNDPVAVTVDTHPGLKLCGYVESLGPASSSEFALVPPDNATGNFTKIVRRFPVRLRLNKREANSAMIKPGMSVVVRTGVDVSGKSSTPQQRASALDCVFDPALDVQPNELRRLPDYPGLGPPGEGDKSPK